jgi:LacI family transcriptional regulator
MSTIKDVAHEACVSLGTEPVLSGGGAPSRTARDRVEKPSRDLRDVVGAPARSRRRSQTDVLGLLVSESSVVPAHFLAPAGGPA